MAGNKKKKKKNYSMYVWAIVFIILFGVFFYANQSFNLINLKTNPIKLYDVEKIDDYYSISLEYEEKTYDSSWGANKEVLSQWAEIGNSIPDDSYINDVNQGKYFCNAYNGKFVKTANIQEGKRYIYDSGEIKKNTWVYNGVDEDIAKTIICALPTGDYVSNSGVIVIQNISIDKTYDYFELNYNLKNNKGSIVPTILFDETEYSLNGNLLPYYLFENNSIDLKFQFILEDNESPKLLNDFELNGIIDNSSENIEVTIDENSVENESQSNNQYSIIINKYADNSDNLEIYDTDNDSTDNINGVASSDTTSTYFAIALIIIVIGGGVYFTLKKRRKPSKKRGK